MINRRIFSFTLGTILCSAGLVTVAATPESAVSIPADGPDFFFGLRTAGVWVGDLVPQGAPALRSITTYNADGTFTTSTSDSYLPGGLRSASHGVWERIGPRTIRNRQLALDFTATGQLEYWFRTDWVVDLDRNLQSGPVQGSTSLFLPTQNPLDPTAVPIFSIPFTGTTQRMTLP